MDQKLQKLGDNISTAFSNFGNVTSNWTSALSSRFSRLANRATDSNDASASMNDSDPKDQVQGALSFSNDNSINQQEFEFEEAKDDDTESMLPA